MDRYGFGAGLWFDAGFAFGGGGFAFAAGLQAGVSRMGASLHSGVTAVARAASCAVDAFGASAFGAAESVDEVGCGG